MLYINIIKTSEPKWLSEVQFLLSCPVFLHKYTLPFQSHLWNSVFGPAFSSISNGPLISSMIAKRRPINALFKFGNRKRHMGPCSAAMEAGNNYYECYRGSFPIIDLCAHPRSIHLLKKISRFICSNVSLETVKMTLTGFITFVRN